MPPRHDHPSRHTVEAVLDAALAAQRGGGLAGWAKRYPRVMRWLRERWLAPVLDGLGDAVPAARREDLALELLLLDALSQLRPDRLPHLADIDETAWIQRT